MGYTAATKTAATDTAATKTAATDTAATDTAATDTCGARPVKKQKTVISSLELKMEHEIKDTEARTVLTLKCNSSVDEITRLDGDDRAERPSVVTSDDVRKLQARLDKTQVELNKTQAEVAQLKSMISQLKEELRQQTLNFPDPVASTPLCNASLQLSERADHPGASLLGPDHF